MPKKDKARIAIPIETAPVPVDETEPHEQNGTPVAGFEDIVNLVATPFPIQFMWKGKTCEIIARHLTPAESEMLKLQLDAVLPPFVRGKVEAEDRFDFYNAEFLARKTKIEREVRAQALFWCCQAFQKRFEAATPGAVADMYKPQARGAIVAFVQGLLVEEVLEHLYLQIRKANGSVAEKVNFV